MFYFYNYLFMQVAEIERVVKIVEKEKEEEASKKKDKKEDK